MKKRAFVRYSKQGKIVPGSMILTSGSFPSGPSTWKEIPADLCCPICPTLVCTKYRNDNPQLETIEGVVCGANSSGDNEVNPGETICMQTVLGTTAPFTAVGDCGCDKS